MIFFQNWAPKSPEHLIYFLGNIEISLNAFHLFRVFFEVLPGYPKHQLARPTPLPQVAPVPPAGTFGPGTISAKDLGHGKILRPSSSWLKTSWKLRNGERMGKSWGKWMVKGMEVGKMMGKKLSCCCPISVDFASFTEISFGEEAASLVRLCGIPVQLVGVGGGWHLLLGLAMGHWPIPGGCIPFFGEKKRYNCRS